MSRLLTASALALLAATSASAAEPRLDQIQVIGTHNSYSQPADPRVFPVMKPLLQPMLDGMMKMMPPAMAAQMADEHPNPLAADLQSALDYIHAPLEAQLRMGLRSLELDLNVDSKGGKFLDPLAYRLLKAKGEKDLAPLYTDALREPGLKVLHMADLDFRSSCPTFRICLRQLRAWSDAHPDHTPVFILLEPKFQGFTERVGGTALEPFDKAAFDELDGSIQEVLGRDRVVTPDDVRGKAGTLEAAVKAGGWPTLDKARGKFVFLMLVPAMNLQTFGPYLEGRPNLEGRMAFVQGEPGMAHTAFMLIDNALTHGDEIRALVKQGYLVRTRADIDTYEARKNDPKRREAALASGAQIVSTDYPWAPNIFGNAYAVSPDPQGVRSNPVTGKR
jgi:hypothetical protein